MSRFAYSAAEHPIFSRLPDGTEIKSRVFHGDSEWSIRTSCMCNLDAVAIHRIGIRTYQLTMFGSSTDGDDVCASNPLTLTMAE